MTAATAVLPSTAVSELLTRVGDSDNLVAFFEAIVRANLPATAMRTLLEVAARMIRRGMVTECVPLDVTAVQLGVHRNGIGLAFAQLESAGFLARSPVKHRGAPTRTTLCGVTRRLIFHATREQLTAVNDSGDQPTEVCPAEKSVPTAPIHDPQAVVTASALTPSSLQTPAFKFDREINASMMAKVPAETRLMASQGLLASKAPEDVWMLSEAEEDHYRALFPKPEPKPVRRRTAVQSGAMPLATLTPAVRQGVTEILTRLRKATRTEQEAQLVADQIAYMVEHKGLGRGNAISGVYAGLKLVEDKRWSEPRDWPTVSMFWRGATFRALVDNFKGTERNPKNRAMPEKPGATTELLASLEALSISNKQPG